MTFYCVEKAKDRDCGAKETLGIPQCHYCYEYQRGYIEPTSPVPALRTDNLYWRMPSYPTENLIAQWSLTGPGQVR